MKEYYTLELKTIRNTKKLQPNCHKDHKRERFACISSVLFSTPFRVRKFAVFAFCILCLRLAFCILCLEAVFSNIMFFSIKSLS